MGTKGSKSTYCMIKMRSVSAVEKTAPSLKSSNPKWNETFTLPINIVEKEVKILVYLTRKLFCIGEIVIPLDSLKSLESTDLEKWWPIKPTSHVQIQGELLVRLKYSPLNEKAIDEETLFKETQLALMRSLQSGTLSTYETLERAILDERGILESEYKKISKMNGSDSDTAKTVHSMLQSLENKSKELRLYTVEDFDQSLIEKFEKIVDRKLDNIIPSFADEKSSQSNDPFSLLLRNIFNSNASKQLELLISLEEKLLIDADKRSFITSGSVSTLLKLLGDADVNCRLKLLSILQDLSFYLSNRMYKETLLINIVETIAPMRLNQSPECILLSSAIIANAALSKDTSVQEYFNNGKGKELLIRMLDSNLESVNIRALWAISCMPSDGKGELIKSVHDVFLAFLSSDNNDLLKWTTSAFSNLTYCEKNHKFFDFQLILPLLIKILSNADSRLVFESLRAITNICFHENVQTMLEKGEELNIIMGLLSSKDSDVQMQTSWLLSNFANNEKSICIIKGMNGVEKLVELIGGECSDEVKRKSSWALLNLLTNEGCKEIFYKTNGLEVIMNLLSQSSIGELLLRELLKILMFLINFEDFLSALLTHNAHQMLAQLFAKDFSLSIKEQICWVISKLAFDSQYKDKFREVGVLENLVEMIEEGGSSSASKAAIWAIFNLSISNEENIKVMKKIAIEPLVRCMQDKNIRDITAKTLSILATDEAEKMQIIDVVSRSVKTLKISYSK